MNFRRLFTAMALLALCVGLASAQVTIGTIGTGSAGNLACSATVASPPQLRAEGLTELAGDIVLQCTGGPVPTVGVAAPTANITVSLGTNVTSRLLPVAGAANASEALLMIDEPGSGLPGPVPGSGPSAPQIACTNPLSGSSGGLCPVYPVVSAGYIVASSSPTTLTNPTNIYQGLVNANQVAFNGIPIIAPSTVGIARVFRITNIRANTNALGGGGLAGVTQLTAYISISGSTALPVNNPILTAGFIQTGLTTAVKNPSTGASSLQQCSTAFTTPVAIAALNFSENFATAFKTRLGANTNATATNQNIPGAIYNSESGFVQPTIMGTNGATAGLADAGTRLKAVFNNVPTGAKIYVSAFNTSGSPSSAGLVVSETTPDSVSGPPLVSPSQTISQLAVVGNTATAVWEVLTTNTNLSETLGFTVYISYTANTGSNSPTPGTATVNMSYAPTSTTTSASSTAFVPRFVDTSSASNVFTISVCQTVLLYPFVTNQSGFDTGIAIANTTSDPFGTSPQAGSCTLNFYGASAPSAAVNTGSIATGTVYTTLASTTAAGFQGYMIAVCNFQLAHGFAFISDLGARNLAMGYLALVLPYTNTRVATEMLDN